MVVGIKKNKIHCIIKKAMNVYLIKFIIFIFILNLFNCRSILSKKLIPIGFDYKKISENYFSNPKNNPYPLTIGSGSNYYSSIDHHGKFLFYTNNDSGNSDIYLRDLETSAVSRITFFPSKEQMPSICQNGSKLIFYSDKDDSNGDIFLLTLDPKKIISNSIKGQNFVSKELNNLTEEKNKSREGFVDTQPQCSPNNDSFIFSSDRLTPGIINVVKYEFKSKKFTLLTSQGGHSASWSGNGNSIVYISQIDNEQGEIYKKYLQEEKTVRLTYNTFIEFSPGYSDKDQNILFNSIENDTNHDLKIDSLDHSSIKKINLENNEIEEIFPNKYSIMDTRFSNFNGGTIIFSASIYNNINVFFIPTLGLIQLKNSIEEQFKFLIELKRSSPEYLSIGLEFFKKYFQKDKLYPIFEVRSLELINLNSDKNESSNPLLKIEKIIQNSKDKKTTLLEIKDYYNSIKLSILDPNIHASILLYIHDLSSDQMEKLHCLEKIEKDYKEYYEIDNVYRKIFVLKFQMNLDEIPKEFIYLINKAKSSEFDLKLYNDFVSILFSVPLQKSELILNNYFSKYFLETDTKNRLFYFLTMIQSELYSLKNNIEASNNYIDTVINNSLTDNFLISYSYKIKLHNFKILRNEKEYFAILESYILSDFDLESFQFSDFEDLIQHLDNKGKKCQLENKFKESRDSYLSISNILHKLTSNSNQKNLINELNKIYYQQKLSESTFRYAEHLNENRKKNLLIKYTNYVSNNFFVKNTIGRLKDWKNFEILAEGPLKELEEHYSKILLESREKLDLNTLYGYAYYLTNKAVINEKYYIDINLITKAKKDEILYNFKKAEYELTWIIFADPSFHEAFILLGWINQYIDFIKSKKYNFRYSHAEKYKTLYTKYFPDYNYEKNIDLYKQIITYLGDHYKNYKVLSDLNLNLGNNYFLLKNYPSAKESYEIVDALSSKIIKKYQFNDYDQAGLFYYNYGRTLYYLGDYKKAIKLFKKSINYYYNMEYLPLWRNNLEFNENKPKNILTQITPFIYSNMKKIFNGIKNTILQKESDQFKNQDEIDESQEKFIILYLYTGISYYYLKNYKEAAYFLQITEELNNRLKILDSPNLYFLVSICFQKIGYYNKSNLYISKAEDYLNNWERNKFIKIIPKYSLWDVILPEKDRIIGQSRFPDNIPINFQHLISKGIQINNSFLQNKQAEAFRLVEERAKYIKEKKFDEIYITKLIDIYSKNYQGFLYFHNKDYIQSSKYFEESTKEEMKEHVTDTPSLSLKNLTLSDIALINASNPDNTVEIIKKDISILQKVKKSYVERCSLNFKSDKNQNFTDFCENKFHLNWLSYDPLLGILYYQLGEKYFYEKNELLGSYYLGLAYSYYKNPSKLPEKIIGLILDPYPKQQRVNHLLNLSSIFYKLQDWKNFDSTLNMAEELSNEFYLFKHQYLVFIEKTKYYLISNNKEGAIKTVLKAEELIYTYKSLIKELSDLQIAELFRLKKEIFNNYFEEEKLSLLMNFKSFIKNNYEFNNSKENEIYFQLKNSLIKEKQIISKINSLSNKRRKYSKELDQLTKNVDKTTLIINQYLNEFPNKFIFLNIGTQKQNFDLTNSNEAILQFHNKENKILARLYHKNIKEEFILNSQFIDNSKLSKNLSKFKRIYIMQDTSMRKKEINLFLQNNKLNSQVFLISKTYQIPYVRDSVISNDEQNFSFLTLSEKSEKNSNFSSSSYEKLNTIILDLSDKKNQFGLFNEEIEKLTRQIFTGFVRIEYFIIKIDENASLDWEMLSLVDELLASGVKKILFCNELESITQQLKEQKIDESILDSSYSSIGVYKNFGSKEQNYYSKYFKEGLIKNHLKNYEESLKFFNLATLDNDQNLTLVSKLYLNLTQWMMKGSVKDDQSIKTLINNNLLNENNLKYIYLTATLQCFFIEFISCDSYYKEFKLHSLPSEYEIITKIKFLLEGKLLDKPLNFESVLTLLKIKSSIKEDVFLLDPFWLFTNLSNLYHKNYELTLALRLLSIAERFKVVEDDLDKIKKLEIELNLSKYFVEGFKFGNFQSEELTKSMYSIFSNKNDTPSYFFSYNTNLQKLLRKTISKDWYETWNLLPSMYLNTKNSIRDLSPIQIDLLFFLILESLENQEKKELNVLFDLIWKMLVDQGYKNKALHFILSFIDRNVILGNIENANDYLKNFNKLLEPNLNSLEIRNRTIDIVTKLLLIKNDEKTNVPTNSELNQFLIQLDNSSSKEYIPLFNQYLSKNSFKIINTKIKNDLLTIIQFIQTKSIKQKDYHSIINFEQMKIKLDRINECLLCSKVSISELDQVKDISQKLLNTLPDNQNLVSIINVGSKTIRILFKNQKVKFSIFKRNQFGLKYQIYSYYSNFGENFSKHPEYSLLSIDYTKKLKLHPEKLTYLYLGSYHLKAPIQTNSKYLLLSNHEELLKNKSIQLRQNELNFKFLVTKKSEFEKLMEKELLTYSNQNSKDTLFFIDMLPKNSNEIFSWNHSSNFKKLGLGIFNDLGFNQSEFSKINLLKTKNLLTYYDSIFSGIGIISLQPINPLNHLEFLEKMVSTSKKNIFDQFQEGIEASRNKKSLNNDWNRYRLYTNSFVELK